ncbi:hypothetical protein UlMin_019981 [Ulmus minor]
MEEGILRPRSPRRVLHQGMGTKVSRDVRKSGWGPQLGQATYKNRQRLYLSEQTDGSVPNTLVIANCEVVKRRVAAVEHISQFNEEACSPFVKKYKTIIHPGEGCVNQIRELAQNSKIVGTHTDSPDAQPNRHVVLGAANSSPDLVSTVHKDNAEFPFAMCPTDPFVLSGGQVSGLWSIQDQISTLASESTPAKSPGSGGTNTNLASKGAGNNYKLTDSPSIGSRGIYYGHEDTVEDVQFCPTSPQEFCSVGDDSCLILWDSRSGSTPVVKYLKKNLIGSNAPIAFSEFNFNLMNPYLNYSSSRDYESLDWILSYEIFYELPIFPKVMSTCR